MSNQMWFELRMRKEEEKRQEEEAARKAKEEERQRKIDAGEEVSDEGEWKPGDSFLTEYFCVKYSIIHVVH